MTSGQYSFGRRSYRGRIHRMQGTVWQNMPKAIYRCRLVYILEAYSYNCSSRLLGRTKVQSKVFYLSNLQLAWFLVFIAAFFQHKGVTFITTGKTALLSQTSHLKGIGGWGGGADKPNWCRVVFHCCQSGITEAGVSENEDFELNSVTGSCSDAVIGGFRSTLQISVSQCTWVADMQILK